MDKEGNTKEKERAGHGRVEERESARSDERTLTMLALAI